MTDANVQHIRSPEVHGDDTVTLRLKSGAARKILARIAAEELLMTKAETDVWAITTSKLPAGIHDYSFDVDGTRMLDPSNRRVKKWFSLAGMVEVPGDPPLLTKFKDVPHGVIQKLIYPSTTVGHSRPVMVYIRNRTTMQRLNNPIRWSFFCTVLVTTKQRGPKWGVLI